MTERNRGALTLIWAGTRESLEEYLQAMDRAESNPQLMVKLFEGDDDDDDERLPYELAGDVALVEIRGPLISSGNWITRFFGLTAYSDIRNSLVRAAQDDRVGSILLDVDSGGGSSTGISDVSGLIHMIDSQVKPVYAHTGGNMLSAAYWIGAAARKVYASPSASLGSIGVIATHMEYSQRLKQEKINATILRAGEYKALGHPLEPLSEKAEKYLQGQIDQFYNLFIQHVSASRNRPEDWVRGEMAEGRVFLASEAVARGLADGVKFVDELAQELQGQGSKQRPSSGMTVRGGHAQPRLDAGDLNAQGGDMARKKVLTAQATAAIASGADLNTALKGAPDEETPESPETQGTPETPEIQGTPETPETQGTPETPETQGTPETPEIQGTPETPAAPVDVVSFLRSELASANEKVISLSSDLKHAQVKVGALESTDQGLRKIAAEAINRMQIAMGGQPVSSYSDLPGATLVEMYSKTQKDFQAAFPVGGKAEVASTEPPASTVAGTDNVTAITRSRGAVKIGK